MCWLDGGGSRYRGGRRWSTRHGVLGVLTADDVSLTFDAATREVRRHQHDRDEVVGDDVFTVLAEEVARDDGDRDVSWVGYLGYACRTDLPARPGEGLVPDAVLLRVPAERLQPTPSERVTPRAATALPRATTAEPTPGWYVDAFAEVQRQLRAGNSYEVNLTYRERQASPTDPVTAYRRLRALNPAPYAGYLQHHGVHLLSSSPERYATVDRTRTLEARPIKGTTSRAADPEDDAEHQARLAHEPKFRAENLMITDLLRNDLAMVCDPGTVEVPELMVVESYPTVHQLVSTVRGRLRDDVSTVVALRALFPAGSMTGAPKRRTMEIIDAVEATPRGVYSGAFGWISADGRADLAVVIRSLVAHEGTGSGGWSYTWGTGGGITVRSDVADEYAETRWKADRLRAALL